MMRGAPGGFKYSAAWWLLRHPAQSRQARRYRRAHVPPTAEQMVQIRQSLDDIREIADLVRAEMGSAEMLAYPHSVVRGYALMRRRTS